VRRTARTWGGKTEQKSMDLEGNRWNWPVKIGGMIDQHQRQQICGPKPQTTQQILRSKFELFFGEKFLGKFLGEIGGIGGSNPWQPLL
jgi:hypothetical protein